jgi:hypothetical protein
VQSQQSLVMRTREGWRPGELLEGIRIVGAVRTDALRAGTIALFTMTDTRWSSVFTMRFTDELRLVVLDTRGPQLTEIGSLLLGEIGCVPIGRRSDTWRIFHRVSIASRDCVEVALDHAWRAQYDWRRERLGRERELESEVQPRYGATVGRHRLGADEFVAGGCP